MAVSPSGDFLAPLPGQIFDFGGIAPPSPAVGAATPSLGLPGLPFKTNSKTYLLMGLVALGVVVLAIPPSRGGRR